MRSSDGSLRTQRDRRHRVRHHGKMGAHVQLGWMPTLSPRSTRRTRSSSAQTRRSIAARKGSRPISTGCPDGVRRRLQFTDVKTALVAPGLINMAGTASFLLERGRAAALGQDQLGHRSRRRRLENRQPSRFIEDPADRSGSLGSCASSVLTRCILFAACVFLRGGVRGAVAVGGGGEEGARAGSKCAAKSRTNSLDFDPLA